MPNLKTSKSPHPKGTPVEHNLARDYVLGIANERRSDHSTLSPPHQFHIEPDPRLHAHFASSKSPSPAHGLGLSPQDSWTHKTAMTRRCPTFVRDDGHEIPLSPSRNREPQSHDTRVAAQQETLPRPIQGPGDSPTEGFWNLVPSNNSSQAALDRHKINNLGQKVALVTEEKLTVERANQHFLYQIEALRRSAQDKNQKYEELVKKCERLQAFQEHSLAKTRTNDEREIQDPKQQNHQVCSESPKIELEKLKLEHVMQYIQKKLWEKDVVSNSTLEKLVGNLFELDDRCGEFLDMQSRKDELEVENERLNQECERHLGKYEELAKHLPKV